MSAAFARNGCRQLRPLLPGLQQRSSCLCDAKQAGAPPVREMADVAFRTKRKKQYPLGCRASSMIVSPSTVTVSRHQQDHGTVSETAHNDEFSSITITTTKWFMISIDSQESGRPTWVWRRRNRIPNSSFSLPLAATHIMALLRSSLCGSSCSMALVASADTFERSPGATIITLYTCISPHRGRANKKTNVGKRNGENWNQCTP